MDIIDRALKVLNEEGFENYSSKLSETDCVQKDKKVLTFLTRKEHKKYEISEKFARQVMNRKKLNVYVEVLKEYCTRGYVLDSNQAIVLNLIIKTLRNFNDIFKNKLDDDKTNELMLKAFTVIKQAVELCNYGSVCDVYNKPRKTYIQVKTINPILKDEKTSLENVYETTLNILGKSSFKGE